MFPPYSLRKIARSAGKVRIILMAFIMKVVMVNEEEGSVNISDDLTLYAFGGLAFTISQAIIGDCFSYSEEYTAD